MDDDTETGTDKKRRSATEHKKLSSLAKQFLSCSGAILAPLALALICQREYTKQFYYKQIMDDKYTIYGPAVSQCAGAIFSAFSLRLLGRKNSLVLTNLMHLVPLMMFLADVSLEHDFAASMIFHAARRFQIPIVTVYIAEVSEATFRAAFVGLFYVVFLSGYFVNELYPANSKLLSSAAMVAAVVSIVAAMQATESPYWLALRGKREKAEKAYEGLRGADSAASDEALDLFEQADEDTQQLARGLLANVFSLRFGIPLLVTAFLFFSDIDLATLHKDTYDKYTAEIHFFDESYDKPFLFGKALWDILKYTMPIAGALLFCLLCAFVGRRILFLGSIALSLCLFAWYLVTKVPAYIYPISYLFSFTGAKQIPIILASEIYPGITRDLGAAASEFIEVIFYAIDHLAIEKGEYTKGYRTFLNFRWTLIPVGLICTYFYMPETKNATLVETDKLGSEITIP